MRSISFAPTAEGEFRVAFCIEADVKTEDEEDSESS